ncbi:DNA repair protein [bacterium 210820-DFI.6.37]|nr:DNA repair protein [bacterium 210820-DFI.6.37]
MTDKDLRRLNRAELLEMLLAQMEENEKLKQSLEETQKALADRRIAIDQAGTLAEAALKLNGVFDAADRAVRQYLENIQRMTRERGDKE